MENWVSYFDEEQYGFSKSFKKELSNQLRERFIDKLEYENLFDKYFYSLFLGMKEVSIREQDNYVFGNVEIISPDSQSRSLTICWQSDFFENKLEIHKQDVDGKIHFFFCSDFPTEELKKYIKYKKPKKVINSNDLFQLDISFNNFPDLTITFEGKLTPKEENEIVEILKRNKKVFVSDFKGNLILLDFQTNSDNNLEESIQEAKDYMKESLTIIKNSVFGAKINRIVIV